MELYLLPLDVAIQKLHSMNLSNRTTGKTTEVIQNLSKERYLSYSLLPDTDDYWIIVDQLVNSGVRNILFVGPPGTSKTWYALHIAAKLTEYKKTRFRNIQFHQSFGYEDFMEGYIPTANSQSGFTLVPKTFLEICTLAKNDNENLYVLVIDELIEEIRAEYLEKH